MKVKAHNLKLVSQFFDETFCSENKRVEIRINDRDYQRGDLILYGNLSSTYYAEILHVLSGWGLQDGYVALSIKIITERNFHKILNQ